MAFTLLLALAPEVELDVESPVELPELALTVAFDPEFEFEPELALTGVDVVVVMVGLVVTVGLDVELAPDNEPELDVEPEVVVTGVDVVIVGETVGLDVELAPAFDPDTAPD
jgi:hypothetical protein